MPLFRPMKIGFASIRVCSWSSSRRPDSSNSRMASSAPGGMSCATPPGLMKAWFIRRPVISSSTSRVRSRSRAPCV